MTPSTSSDLDPVSQARDTVERTLAQVKTYLAQESPRRLSEADTKANFIEPLILALGWSGIGSVTREYYVRNSQEFIDYVMFGPVPPQSSSGPLLAIEAKALMSELTEKHAAQLVQYCSVEGIEWAALTNGRELQLFNSFLKPDLEAKRILKLDLLAFNTDAEFEALFSQIWRLSRESLTEPSGVRTWLNQLRLDAELRQMLLDPSSPTIAQMRRRLGQAEVSASANDVTSWFRTHLVPSIASVSPVLVPSSVPEAARTGTNLRPTIAPSLDNDLPAGEQVYGVDRFPRTLGVFRELQQAVSDRLADALWRPTKYYFAASSGGETFLFARLQQFRLQIGLTLPETTSHPRLEANSGHIRWPRITRITYAADTGEVDEELVRLIEQAREHALRGPLRTKQHYGIRLADLLSAGLVAPGTPLVLKSGQRICAEATLREDGFIVWQGSACGSPSDKRFAPLINPTRTTLNGWTHWHAKLPEGDVSLAELRSRFTEAGESPD